MFISTAMVESLLEYYDSNYENLRNDVMVCKSKDALIKIIDVIDRNMVEYGKKDTDFITYNSNPFFTIKMISWILVTVEQGKSITESCTECLIWWTNVSEGRNEYNTLKLGDIVPIEKMLDFTKKLRKMVTERLSEL